MSLETPGSAASGRRFGVVSVVQNDPQGAGVVEEADVVAIVGVRNRSVDLAQPPEGVLPHAANRLAPKFLQIENLSSRGKIILWRDKIPPDEKKSTALGDVPDSGNLCRNHAPNFLWRKVTDPLWRGCMPSGRSSTKTRFLQVNVDLLYL